MLDAATDPPTSRTEAPASPAPVRSRLFKVLMRTAWARAGISGSSKLGMMPLGELLINARRLAVLREVARTGSFAGAAAALHHTPSAVSQQIAALERGAGAVLVERSTRGVTLTDAGRVLLATADAIHAELQVAAQQLRALRAGGPQALTVVTFPSAGEPLLAPALTALTGSSQPVEVTVIEAEPEQALGSIRDGQADLALVYHFHTPAPPRAWPAAAGPGTYTALVTDHLRLLVPAAHRPAGRQPGRVRRRSLDPRVGRGRRRPRHARYRQRLPAPGRLPLQRLPLHERPRRRRGRRRPRPRPRPHRPPRRARHPDHSPAHPLRRRLPPAATPAKPSRRTTARSTPYSRARETGDPERPDPWAAGFALIVHGSPGYGAAPGSSRERPPAAGQNP